MIINPSSNRSEPVIPITGTPNIRTQLWIDPTVEDQNSSYYTAADTLTNSTKELMGLGTNAVPDDAFKALLEKTENIPIPEAGMTMDLLWENAAPTSTFAAQTVELDLTEYEFVLVGATHRYTLDIPHDERETIGIFRKGYPTTMMFPSDKVGSSPTFGYIRRSVSVTDTGISFGSGYYASTQGDYAAIPVFIFGIKGVTTA